MKPPLNQLEQLCALDELAQFGVQIEMILLWFGQSRLTWSFGQYGAPNTLLSIFD
jgi:hypothetical protein